MSELIIVFTSFIAIVGCSVDSRKVNFHEFVYVVDDGFRWYIRFSDGRLCRNAVVLVSNACTRRYVSKHVCIYFH